MPVGFGELGAAIGAFMPEDKVKQKYYNQKLAELYGNDYVDSLKHLAGTSSDALAAYKTALDAGTPEATRIQAEDIGNLGTLIKSGVNYDPLAGYERIRSGNIDALNNQFGNLASYGSAADKIALASRGYGGRGDGTYERTLRADRISKNIAPVLNTIFGNLGRDTATTSQDRYANLASVLQLMKERGQLPDALAGRALLPAETEANMLGNQLQLGGTLGQATKENTAGFQTIPNKWREFFKHMGRSTDQAADTLLSVYSGGMLGGGGGAGGILGGSGGGAAAATAAPPAYVGGQGYGVPPGFDYTPPQTYSPYLTNPEASFYA